MPWKSQSSMEAELQELIDKWLKKEQSFSRLCEATGISRKTGYKWIKRFKVGGITELEPRSRRPLSNSRQVSQELREKVEALRRKYPDSGPKKLRVMLRARGQKDRVPAASTI